MMRQFSPVRSMFFYCWHIWVFKLGQNLKYYNCFFWLERIYFGYCLVVFVSTLEGFSCQFGVVVVACLVYFSCMLIWCVCLVWIYFRLVILVHTRCFSIKSGLVYTKCFSISKDSKTDGSVRMHKYDGLCTLIVLPSS